MYQEPTSENILEEAHLFFDSAHEEFCRPEEDVVPFMICLSAYRSVGKYLTAYLYEHGLNIYEPMSLEIMLDKCRNLNPRFRELDLAPMFYGNAHREDIVVADWDTINEYLQLARKTRDLIVQELGLM